MSDMATSKDMTQLYNERINRILTTTNHQEPDRVPIHGLINTWAISYGNSTIKECLENPEKALTEVYSKPYRDIYFDSTAEPILVPKNMRFYQILGNDTYFTSEDGTTLQHDEGITMDPEDYLDLINDPMNFLFGKFLKKRYPDVTIEKIAAGIKELLRNNEISGKYITYFKEELGIPVFVNGASNYAYPPLDLLFDNIRGFKGTLVDLRRRPQQVIDAMDALFPLSKQILNIDDNVTKAEPFPFVATMMHSPTFISHKQFLKFFAPHYEKLIYRAHEVGKKLYIFLEGSWEKHYDWLNSLPKDFVIGLVEHGDIFEAKKKIGNNITIAGGMPLELLKYGSKQQCIDHAKRVVEECAPGGGFIFSTDKILLSPSDVNVENLRAVNEYVHEYGVYK